MAIKFSKSTPTVCNHFLRNCSRVWAVSQQELARMGTTALYLPDMKIAVTGKYDSEGRFNRKLKHTMEQNAADDEIDITEDGE